ncbi:hypothetical protein GUJ93_ZPchr0006g43208 [Zizania palustris]|uniref:Uncharacterized protein n=1 Tax=Zizania palustris TaxID=103762 RepID=A0A8J5T1B3_ZIZPA|nr:hypothetical protein GUJ93_ZPchr0006g43208 [Zizania palustris]
MLTCTFTAMPIHGLSCVERIERELGVGGCVDSSMDWLPMLHHLHAAPYPDHSSFPRRARLLPVLVYVRLDACRLALAGRRRLSEREQSVVQGLATTSSGFSFFTSSSQWLAALYSSPWALPQLMAIACGRP